jgi:nitrite reductase/ring-hydroxylating ferredoxin subunit
MTELATGPFRTIASASAVPDDLVVPCYLDDRKLGSRFEITTGVVTNGPATEALRVYDVQQDGGSIRIRA